MSTPETDSLLRKCHNSYGDERAELIHFCRKMERERDQATERLNHAEILLSDLACGYWRAVLNEQDPSGEGLMGERVAQYWARYCEQSSTTKP